MNQFAQPDNWARLLQAAEHLRARGRWKPTILLAMPDHVHAIACVPKTQDLGQVLSGFKRACAYQGKIRWQRDAFDRRLRNFHEQWLKLLYVKFNPVEAGLVTRPEEWPYVKTWDPD